jgi:hypothetical protein
MLNMDICRVAEVRIDNDVSFVGEPNTRMPPLSHCLPDSRPSDQLGERGCC